MPAYERQRILRAISDAIASRQDEFARSISMEAGKPIKMRALKSIAPSSPFQSQPKKALALAANGSRSICCLR